MNVDYVDCEAVFWYNSYMKRIINIGNKKQASKQLNQFKNKQYESVEIEFINVHLTSINELVGFKLFNKTSLFARSSMLWEIMQPVGKVGRHHYHGLEPTDIVNALSLLQDPLIVYESYLDRYAVIVFGNDKYTHIMAVVELNAALENDRNANVNKLVTIYPKNELDKTINNLDKSKILYKK